MDPRDSAVSSAAGRGRDSAASSRAPLEVIFVCVSRGTTVLAEFANPSHAPRRARHQRRPRGDGGLRYRKETRERPPEQYTITLRFLDV